MKTNFSQTQSEIFDLALDLYRGDFSRHIDETKVTKKDLENHLRDMINKDMLGGKTLYQAVRRNKIELYEIVEELVNTAINEDVLNSPFIDAFVEVKNRGLGDKTEFYAEGGLLSVATFAGNHWDTDRQAVDLGSEITLPKEWIFIHVYEELERFLIGITIDGVTSASQSAMDTGAFVTIDSTTGKLVAKATATSGATFEGVVEGKRTMGGTLVTTAHTYGHSAVMYKVRVVTYDE